LIGAFSLEAAENALGETRTALEKWVQTRQLISQTRSDWASEKEMVEASIALFEKELKDLEASFDRIGTNSLEISKEKAALQKEESALQAAADRAAALVGGLEAEIVSLNARLPESLRADLSKLIDQIPQNSEETQLSASKRMQNIVGILNEIEKFNNSITVQSEIRQNDDGSEVQVETLYLGLAQAYYVGQEGKFAGLSRPSEEGWVLQQEDALGPDISRAIGVYRNQVPATFVSLPLNLE
jgi:hypothetical protein